MCRNLSARLCFSSPRSWQRFAEGPAWQANKPSSSLDFRSTESHVAMASRSLGHHVGPIWALSSLQMLDKLPEYNLTLTRVDMKSCACSIWETTNTPVDTQEPSCHPTDTVTAPLTPRKNLPAHESLLCTPRPKRLGGRRPSCPRGTVP